MSLIPFSFNFSVACPVNSTGYVARYNNNEATVCSAAEITVYIPSTDSFTTGTTVYIDASLNTPLTGFTFISETVSATIWNLDSSTGVIGTSTGNAC